MSRASRWAERQKDEVQVDRPRFESVTVEAWVTDKGELAVWHKAVLGAKDAVMTPPDTALALATWIDNVFSDDVLDRAADASLISSLPLDWEATPATLAKFNIDPSRLVRGWSDPSCNRCAVKCPYCATAPQSEPPASERLGEPIQTEPQFKQARRVHVGGQARWGVGYDAIG